MKVCEPRGRQIVGRSTEKKRGDAESDSGSVQPVDCWMVWMCALHGRCFDLNPKSVQRLYDVCVYGAWSACQTLI